MFKAILLVWLSVAVVAFFVLLKVRAPYGRHRSPGWGPSIDHRLGWFLMELPSPVVFTWFILSGGNPVGMPALLFTGLWVAHYFNRAVLFPMRMRNVGRTMPLVVVGSAVLFNVLNAGLNGYYLGYVADPYGAEWLLDPRFVTGSILFVCGAAVNIRSDSALLRLRRVSLGRYAMPSGLLFRYVSSPNYLGEIIEWIGYAVLTWSPAAAVFAFWTVANLVPRALANHQWYRENFEDYPTGRKALVPYVL